MGWRRFRFLLAGLSGQSRLAASLADPDGAGPAIEDPAQAEAAWQRFLK